jgi:hypothetical protein
MPLMADKYLKASKNEDIKFLGDKMNENKWKGILVVLAYSLLPSYHSFLRWGISKNKATLYHCSFLSRNLLVILSPYI